jgi:osmoprotectant transport system substrate-binding protein
MKRVYHTGVTVLLLVFVLLLGACGSDGGETKEKEEGADAAAAEEEKEGAEIVVASKIDTEGALLGSMMVQLLRQEGFDVTDKTQFGPTDVIRKAIQSGEIDIYPEYTGNGAFFFQDSPRDVWKDPERGYETVKELDLEENGLVWLQPSPANNTWAIAVRRDLSEEADLRTLEDLASYLQEGGEFKLAASEEFVTREDVLPAFEESYGFELSDDQLLTFSSGNTAQTERAAAQGTDGVNAAMAYGTDGQLAALGLRVLDDVNNVMPVYRPAPLVRQEVLDAHPEIEEILSPVFEKLDRETLQRLNSKIAVEGLAAEEVAEEFLTEMR